MSPPLRRLCGLLIRDLYGDFYSFIFKHLAEQGRLSAQQLAQRSRLPLKQVQSGLAALIRLHLVQHYSSLDNPATYSADLDNAYDLLRAGKLIRSVDETYGSIASTVISTACDLRYCTVAELKSQLQCDGFSSPDQPDTMTVSGIIDRLLEDKFLIHVRKAHFLHLHDIRREVESLNGASGGLTKVTGSKAKLDLEARVMEGVQQRLTTNHTETGYFDAKASLDGQLNGDHSVNGDHLLNGEILSDKVLVKPNLRSITALARIQCAHDEASKKLGKRAAVVLECAVAQVIHRIPWDSNLPSEPKLDLERLGEDIRRTIRRSGDFGADGAKITLPGQVDNIELHRDLTLLSEGPFNFLQMSFDDSWYLDLDKFKKFVQGIEVMRVVGSRLDETANRILRILVAKGRLEEKTLQEMGLLSAKELRQSIAQLQQMGYVELQEVPREASRQPNRTLYLWFHDTERVRYLILDSVYTALANLLQLLTLEREHVADTLLKVERDEVKGREADFLAPAELDLLKRFRRLERWLVAEVHRLDDTVAILQDL